MRLCTKSSPKKITAEISVFGVFIRATVSLTNKSRTENSICTYPTFYSCVFIFLQKIFFQQNPRPPSRLLTIGFRLLFSLSLFPLPPPPLLLILLYQIWKKLQRRLFSAHYVDEKLSKMPIIHKFDKMPVKSNQIQSSYSNIDIRGL